MAETKSQDAITLLKNDHREVEQLFEQFDGLRAFDAVLAASATSVGARTLVSADAAFADLPELRHVVPDVAGVARLLDD